MIHSQMSADSSPGSRLFVSRVNAAETELLHLAARGSGAIPEFSADVYKHAACELAGKVVELQRFLEHVYLNVDMSDDPKQRLKKYVVDYLKKYGVDARDVAG